MSLSVPRDSRFRLLSGLVLLAMAIPIAGHGAVIYSNDFEANTNGFDPHDRGAFCTDLSCTTTSTYLGNRTTDRMRNAELTLTGLTIGVEYEIAFDLTLVGSWDGSLSFGDDFFQLSSSSAGLLINATFRNGFPIGSTTPGQTYSDATPLGGGGLFRTREGADVERGEPIYYFGHGAGNPRPSFVATSTVETLVFQSIDAQGLTDEWFALDNVVVSSTAVPEPSVFALLVLGLLGTRSRRGAIQRG